MLVGERLREMRKQLGLTQEQLAERIGGDRSTISLFEHGKSVSPAIINKIKQTFAVDLSYPPNDWYDVLGDYLLELYRKHSFFYKFSTGGRPKQETITDAKLKDTMMKELHGNIENIVGQMYKFFAFIDDSICQALFQSYNVKLPNNVTFSPDELVRVLKAANLETIEKVFFGSMNTSGGICYLEDEDLEIHIVTNDYELDLKALFPEKSRMEFDLLEIKDIFAKKPELVAPTLTFLKTVLKM